MEDLTAGKVYTFTDARPQPDPIHPYDEDLHGIPIVVDNGSYQCRVGWATDEEPRLQFRNCYAKHRKDRGKKMPATMELLVGNDITNIEAVRFQLKTAHDENVVTHFQAQELLLNYAFSHLGITDSAGVQHPVVMTEPLLNPHHCRGLMSELLFECYNVPRVAYCVDGLANYYNNQDTEADVRLEDGLLVHIGHHTTHIVPVLDGAADVARSRRVKIGGLSMAKFLCRWLQLQYPHQTGNITLSRAEELLHSRMTIATEFEDALQRWGDAETCASDGLTVQFPFTAPTAAVPADPAAQRERRREAARRLVLINARKREEKLVEDEQELERLSELCEAMSEFASYQPEYQHALEEAGASTIEDLHSKMAAMQHRIRKMKAKMMQETSVEEEERLSPAAPSGSALPSDPQEAAEWLESLEKEWASIQRRRTARRSKRQEMAKRRTVASQERMRLISQLARREKKEDHFGRRDEDWDVYKAINKEGGGSDSEEECERLQELEAVLRQHRPHFFSPDAAQDRPLTEAQRHQLLLSTELIRTGELLFQPSMVGQVQGGLMDTVQFVLGLFTPAEQQRLVDNVVVTGGVASMPGLVERIQHDLRAIRPFQSSFRVSKAKTPSLGAWYGARRAATQLLETAGLTRQEYLEGGGDRVRSHCLGNPYWSPIDIETNEEPKESVEASAGCSGSTASQPGSS